MRGIGQWSGHDELRVAVRSFGPDAGPLKILRRSMLLRHAQVPKAAWAVGFRSGHEFHLAGLRKSRSDGHLIQATQLQDVGSIAGGLINPNVSSGGSNTGQFDLSGAVKRGEVDQR